MHSLQAGQFEQFSPQDVFPFGSFGKRSLSFSGCWTLSTTVTWAFSSPNIALGFFSWFSVHMWALAGVSNITANRLLFSVAMKYVYGQFLKA